MALKCSVTARTLVAAGLLVAAAPTAFGQLSESQFTKAQETARRTGKLAGALEACEVISDRLTSRLVQKAELCRASPAQMARIRTLVEQERSTAKKHACAFPSPQAANKTLDELVAKLEDNLRDGNCD
jgi:hypothetical protein